MVANAPMIEIKYRILSIINIYRYNLWIFLYIFIKKIKLPPTFGGWCLSLPAIPLKGVAGARRYHLFYRRLR